jgi:hypothetical protein
MISFIDKKIETWMARGLHKTREKVLKRTLEAYIAKHNPDEDTQAELKAILETEIDHLYIALDKSVIRASIHRARYTFWITLVISTAIIIALASFPVTTSIAPFFVPLMAVTVSWAVSLLTIPISYMHNVQASLDVKVLSFEAERKEAADHPELKINGNSVRDLQRMVRELRIENRQLHQRMDVIEEAQTRDDIEAVNMGTPGTLFWQPTQRDQPENQSQPNIARDFSTNKIGLNAE